MVFSPWTCSLKAPLKVRAWLYLSLPSTNWQRHSEWETRFTQPDRKQRACCLGRRQNRRQEMQQHPPGPQPVAMGCADSTVVPSVRSSLGLWARPSAWIAAVSRQEHKGSPLRLNRAQRDLKGRHPGTMPGTFPFNADSHSSDLHGRGKKLVFYYVLNDRNIQTFTFMKFWGFFFFRNKYYPLWAGVHGNTHAGLTVGVYNRTLFCRAHWHYISGALKMFLPLDPVVPLLELYSMKIIKRQKGCSSQHYL